MFSMSNCSIKSSSCDQLVIQIMEEDDIRKKSPSRGYEENKNKTDRKYPYHKKFFTCFCGKNYNTFSSLFLHCQINHDKNISQKQLKEVRSEWKGKFKHSYIEFIDDQGERGSDIKHKLQVSRFSGNITPKQEQQPIDPQQQILKNETVAISNPESIADNFLKYQEITAIKQANKLSDIRLLLKRLTQFMEINYGKVERKEFKSYCRQSNCNNVALFLNPFFEWCIQKREPLSKMELKELQKLSEWLYCSKKSEYIAELIPQYQV